jgi:hypothetical protein
MSGYFVASIVEGHGEVAALPVLLRRLHQASAASGAPLVVNPPIRIKAGSFLGDSSYRESYLQLAAAKARHSGRKALILVLLDCEDHCPAELGPKLFSSCRAVCGEQEVLVALAHREFETWFMASAPSLGGSRGFPEAVAAPENPEGRRDAKGWISAQLHRRYNEPSDQPAFASVFDLEAAATIPSFARFRWRVSTFFTT